jgi:Spy/CpxP family protein refolding chaperone
MKRHNVLFALAVLFLMNAAAHAQAAPEGPIIANRTFSFTLNPQVQQGEPQSPGLSGRRLVRIAGDQPLGLDLAGGAWWTNAAVVARLGLTDDQKARIERVFENHRANLEINRGQLEKEEALLARFLDAEPFDRNAALSQVYRVIQARSDMEKANALMTLDMREHLTRAQWEQLPRPNVSLSYVVRAAADQNAPRGAGGRGARGQ